MRIAKKQLLNLIDGRWGKEYLNGNDGFNLTLTALNMHSNIFKNVINFQFYQNKIGEVELLIIPNKYYSQNGKKRFLFLLPNILFALEEIVKSNQKIIHNILTSFQTLNHHHKSKLFF